MKKRSRVILTSIIVILTLMLCAFVAGISIKMSNDMKEQYHKKYEIYDFSNKNILIEYGENLSGNYNIENNENTYNKPYWEKEVSYLLSVKPDGTLTKQLYVTSEDEMKYGEDIPCFTKKLTDEQLQRLKNEIVKSEIKIFIKKSSEQYSYNTESLSYKFLCVYADDCKYKLDYTKIKNDEKLKGLYDYFLGLMTEEDNREFEKLKEDYYNPNKFVYDFADADSRPFIMYSETLYNVEDYVTDSFIVSVRLDCNGKINTIGSYNVNNIKDMNEFMKYHNSAKSHISAEEVKEIQNAVVESEFITYGKRINSGYEPPVQDIKSSEKDYLCSYITVCFNENVYYAIDDGTNPKLTRLKNKLLETVLYNVPPDEATAIS